MSSSGVAFRQRQQSGCDLEGAGLEVRGRRGDDPLACAGEDQRVSATDRSSSAAAAASAAAARERARPSARAPAAMSSSGPGDPSARCHARRSGSRSGSVALASARCAACRSASVAARVGRGPHERMSEPHPDADLDESGVDRRRRVDGPDAERARGAPHDHRIAGRFGRGDGEESLRRRPGVPRGGDGSSPRSVPTSASTPACRTHPPARPASDHAAIRRARADCRASPRRCDRERVRRAARARPR